MSDLNIPSAQSDLKVTPPLPRGEMPEELPREVAGAMDDVRIASSADVPLFSEAEYEDRWDKLAAAILAALARVRREALVEAATILRDAPTGMIAYGQIMAKANALSVAGRAPRAEEQGET